MHSIILQGAGGHAKVLIDCEIAQGHTVACMYDPYSDGTLYNIPIRKEYKAGDFPDAKMVIAIGDNATRKRLAAAALHPFGNIIHPSVIFSSYSTAGRGNVMLHGVIVQAQTIIGHHVILNTGSQVDHDCVVGDFVHLGPGAVLCGRVEIGEGTFVGGGSTVIPGKRIGKWSVIGAGSVVVGDIPDHVVAMGNPARVVRAV